jgi:hypothetical protein
MFSYKYRRPSTLKNDLSDVSKAQAMTSQSLQADIEKVIDNNITIGGMDRLFTWK